MQLFWSCPAELQHAVHLIKSPWGPVAETVADRLMADAKYIAQIALANAELPEASG
nr:hypothetical protein [uncultured Oscillibacter sp.]